MYLHQEWVVGSLLGFYKFFEKMLVEFGLDDCDKLNNCYDHDMHPTLHSLFDCWRCCL